MGSFADYLELKLLDHVLGGSDFSPPASLFLALFTAAPSDTGGGTEATGGSYARKEIVNNTTNFPVAGISGSVTLKSNGVDITMFTASGSVSAGANMTHWGLFDALSGGNLLAWGSIDTPAPIGTGDTPTFATGALDITLGGAFGNTIRAALLDLAFGAVSYTRLATVYLALFTAPPGASGGGTEVSGGSYARKAIVNNSTNFPAAASGSKSLNVTHVYDSATANWGTVTDGAIMSAASGGHILWFKTLTSSRTVNSGQTFRIAATDLAVTLD